MASVLTTPGVSGLLTPLHRWMTHPHVSEIMINRPKEVFVEIEGTMTCHPVPEFTEYALSRLVKLIANESLQTLSQKKPLLSATLWDGSRVQVVIPPVTPHITLCIRRKVTKKLGLEDYANAHFYSHTTSFEVSPHRSHDVTEDDETLRQLYHANAWDDFIRNAILAKKNIVISGGTSSGKTTFLNACIAHIPQHERLITLEDTQEIETHHPNHVSLIASKGEQGLASISMQTLVQCALRLRPDRLIVGEVRGREILDFIAAATTGHEGVLTTIHANNPQIAFLRMIQLYKQNNVPAMRDEEIQKELDAVIDIIIQLNKTPEGRKVSGIYYKQGHLA